MDQSKTAIRAEHATPGIAKRNDGSYFSLQAQTRIDAAAAELREALALRCDDATIAEATAFGNRINFALSVLNADTSVEQTTFTCVNSRPKT